jgi:hypothetical protein
VAKYRSLDHVNQYYADAARDLPTSELLTGLASTVGGGWTSRTTPKGILADLVVHHQDIRRPLGRPRIIEPARLRHALQKLNPFAPRAVRGRGRPRR